MGIHIMDVRGKVGNAIYYTLNGKNVARSRPSKVKSTKGMKRNRASFGLAANLSTLLRGMLQNVIPPVGGYLHSRMNGSFARFMAGRDPKELPAGVINELAGFSLNPHCNFDHYTGYITLAVDGTGTLAFSMPGFVPADALRVPKECISVDLVLVAASLEPGTLAGRIFY